MLVEDLNALFNKDLQKLKTEIESYTNEENIWRIDKNISNTAGNLCLHLIGNLNTYIGATLANTGYVRNRPLEFSAKNIPRKELLEKIDSTIKVVAAGLSTLSDGQLKEDYPIVIWEKPTKTGYTLMYLATHLGYHLGQINYHRRLLDSEI
ncbi:MAG: DUF1572 family protein [Chitinophagaceae bacterium]